MYLFVFWKAQQDNNSNKKKKKIEKKKTKLVSNVVPEGFPSELIAPQTAEWLGTYSSGNPFKNYLLCGFVICYVCAYTERPLDVDIILVQLQQEDN